MAEYDATERITLLNLAKDSISYGLAHHEPMRVEVKNFNAHLQESRACFVTLHLNGVLRGCIGSLNATQPLVADVAGNAYRAAFNDPRFPALSSNEFAKIHLDISVLSPPTEIKVSSEQDLLHRLRPGIDGLILSDHTHRATFLPSVWEQLPNPSDFVIHLKNKAGWPSDYWDNRIKVETYTAELIA